MLRTVIIILSIIGFSFALYNGITNGFSFYNLSGLVASLLACLTATANKLDSIKKNEKTSQMEQNISHNSSGIQVGGNIIVNDKDDRNGTSSR